MEGIIIRIVILVFYAGLFVYACLVFRGKIKVKIEAKEELQNLKEKYENEINSEWFKSPSLKFEVKKIKIPHNTQEFFDPTNGEKIKALSVGERDSYEEAVKIIKKLTRLESPMVDALAFLALIDSKVDDELCSKLEMAEYYNLIGPLRKDEEQPQFFNRCPPNFCEALFADLDLWNRMRKVAARSHSGFIDYPKDFVDHEHNNSIDNSIIVYPNEGKNEKELFEKGEKY